MALTYTEIVEILKISQDSVPARSDRYQAFERAVTFHSESTGVIMPEGGRGVFLVGGTNGKGSVAKTLETLLSWPAAVSAVPGVTSKRAPNVGLFTSPHLMEPLERIRSGGRDLSPDEMVGAFQIIQPTIEVFNLSHFEILTLLMIEVFFGDRVRPRVDLAVIEVGVGGRLDPTRVVPHETCVVTSIGLDHEAILGSTLSLIAREKFAIASGARRLIYAPQVAEVTSVITSIRAEYPDLLISEAPIFPATVSMVGGEPKWTLITPWGSVALSLLGARAVENSSVALEVLNECGVDIATVLPGLAAVDWPGRMERLEFANHHVYLSGDHNEAGVKSLIVILGAFDYERVWIVVGVGRGKPLDAMLELYLSVSRASVILTLTSFRAHSLDDLFHWRERVSEIVADPLEALALACRSAGPKDLIVASGSLYMVGDLRKRILSR